jgi:hypothetical protein
MYIRLKCICSSRDGDHLGQEKETCRQDSLSKWIDLYQSRPSCFRWTVPLTARKIAIKTHFKISKTSRGYI